jgi:hypothetical protein
VTHDQIIAVVQAHKEGKQIEYTYKYPAAAAGVWLSMQSPQFFNFADCVYRVKPEPREWWIYEDGSDCPPRAYPTEQVFTIMAPIKGIHVREVLK